MNVQSTKDYPPINLDKHHSCEVIKFPACDKMRISFALLAHLRVYLRRNIKLASVIKVVEISDGPKY